MPYRQSPIDCPLLQAFLPVRLFSKNASGPFSAVSALCELSRIPGDCIFLRETGYMTRKKKCNPLIMSTLLLYISL